MSDERMPELDDLELPEKEGQIHEFLHRGEPYAIRADGDDTWEIGQRVDDDWSTIGEFARRGGDYGVVSGQSGWRSQGSDWRRIVRDLV